MTKVFLKRIVNTHVVSRWTARHIRREQRRLNASESFQHAHIEVSPSSQGDSCACMDCRRLQYLTLDLLSGCKDIHRPLDEVPHLPTALMLELDPFPGMENYEKAIKKKSNGNHLRSVRMAARLGYTTRIIDEHAHGATIRAIEKSKLFRTGGLVWSALFPWVNRSDSDRGPDSLALNCTRHWSICWGAFRDEQLRAFCCIIRSGNFVRVERIMGHRDALKDGVVKLLLIDVIAWLLERNSVTQGTRYFMYGSVEHGTQGLYEWKRRFYFKPTLVSLDRDLKDAIPADFDPDAYLRLNADVRRTNHNPLIHYHVWGRHDDRRFK